MFITVHLLLRPLVYRKKICIRYTNWKLEQYRKGIHINAITNCNFINEVTSLINKYVIQTVSKYN